MTQGHAPSPDVAARLANDLGTRKLQSINQLLLEGLFFYRKDDPQLYSSLTRYQSNFKEFWERYLGIILHIEDNVAYRAPMTTGEEPAAGFRNPNIPLRGRGFFWFIGQGKRERVLVFLRFLQYYEEELRNTEELLYGEHYFFYHEFYDCVQKSFKEWFADDPDGVPRDREIFQATRDVMRLLQRYRFIEQEGDGKPLTDQQAQDLPSGYGEKKVFFFRALPGLRAYNPRTLSESLVLQAYSKSSADSDEDSHEEDEQIGREDED